MAIPSKSYSAAPNSFVPIFLYLLSQADGLRCLMRDAIGGRAWELAHDSTVGPAPFSLVFDAEKGVRFARTGFGIYYDIADVRIPIVRDAAGDFVFVGQSVAVTRDVDGDYMLAKRDSAGSLEMRVPYRQYLEWLVDSWIERDAPAQFVRKYRPEIVTTIDERLRVCGMGK